MIFIKLEFSQFCIQRIYLYSFPHNLNVSVRYKPMRCQGPKIMINISHWIMWGGGSTKDSTTTSSHRTVLINFPKMGILIEIIKIIEMIVRPPNPPYHLLRRRPGWAGKAGRDLGLIRTCCFVSANKYLRADLQSSSRRPRGPRFVL